MDAKSNEQNRITLSITFIATYLTIILGFSDKIKPFDSDLNVINDIAFSVFIIYGTLIVFLFFLYLAFTALDLDFYKKKEVMLDQKISKDKINQIRKSLYNWGVRWIFISFTYPVYYLFAIFKASYSWWLAILLFMLSMALAQILLYIVFKDTK